MFGKLLGRRDTAVRAGLLLVSYLVLLVAGLFGSVPVFAVAALAVVAGELGTVRWAPAVRELLEKANLGQTYRYLARDLATVLLLVGTLELPRVQLSAALLLPAATWAEAAVSGALAAVLKRRHPVPALTRNINLKLRRSAPQPPSWAELLSGERLPFLNVLLLPGALAAALVGSLVPFLALAGTALVAGAVVVAALALTLVRGRKVPQDAVLSAVQQWFTEYRPRVALYSAGPAKDVYQVNMWLDSVAALDQPAVILLRNREAFQQLAATRLPVVCVPRSVDFMNLPFDSLRVALYPANVGANIHLLREPGIKHVFIGHGDSDKQASVNPYSKVYDEVWVAGPAGRDRYARAAVGVEDRDIVEIGRPQLAGVELTAPRTGDRPFTVLYAPTWEGWEDDQQHTSVLPMGESIVRTLLELSPPVRLIYKPHPLTGTRCGETRAAHERVIKMIGAAGGQTNATSLDGPGHRVVLGSRPSLFDCFNETDLLISDISSVVSDFVQTRRPYVVANLGGLPEDEFRQKYPTARAAYLLSTDCGELEKIVELVRSGSDPMSEARRELKAYLLGPDEPSPLERFRAEVTRLVGQA